MGLKIVFLHPDLGIGGAEKAVVDAAMALKSRGHSVQFVTAHHDLNHCFESTRDGTLRVQCVGDWLPRSFFGYFHALCAYVRMLCAALYLVFTGKDIDLVFCDQISICVPLLRFTKARVLFYCHFPDMLLTERASMLKYLYRYPLDWLEEKTTGMADCVLVNSKFTADVFKETFKSLKHITPYVLYPIPDFSSFDNTIHPPTPDLMPSDADIIFLSINRYERKKNVGLAIKALSDLREKEGTLDGIHLIIAGGYDERVQENKHHFTELVALVEQLHLEEHVSFLRSVNDEQKCTLLKHSTCLLYTPDNEHFGIVPIEAMYMKCPVIAVASGGPLETVVDGETGFLCRPNFNSFSMAMERLVNDKALVKALGEAGHNRVIEKFSFASFTEKLNNIVEDLCQSKNN